MSDSERNVEKAQKPTYASVLALAGTEGVGKKYMQDFAAPESVSRSVSSGKKGPTVILPASTAPKVSSDSSSKSLASSIKITSLSGEASKPTKTFRLSEDTVPSSDEDESEREEEEREVETPSKHTLEIASGNKSQESSDDSRGSKTANQGRGGHQGHGRGRGRSDRGGNRRGGNRSQDDKPKKKKESRFAAYDEKVVSHELESVVEEFLTEGSEHGYITIENGDVLDLLTHNVKNLRELVHTTESKYVAKEPIYNGTTMLGREDEAGGRHVIDAEDFF